MSASTEDMQALAMLIANTRDELLEEIKTLRTPRLQRDADIPVERSRRGWLFYSLSGVVLAGALGYLVWRETGIMHQARMLGQIDAVLRQDAHILAESTRARLNTIYRVYQYQPLMQSQPHKK